MAGFGPAPKDPATRARRNKDPNPTIRLPFQPYAPPDLPAEIEWHPVTARLWEVWRNSPMAAIMGETDWAYMLDTALMHNAMWSKGRWEFAAEVRLRLAQFGATPLDRMRLRIQWADADQKDATTPQTVPVPARSRYGQLRVLPLPSGGSETGGTDADEGA